MFKEFFQYDENINYLKKYYDLDNSLKRYGIERMEIKHSNFLRWALSPNNSKSLGTFSLKWFIKLIQTKLSANRRLKKIDLDHACLEEIDILREKKNIDLLITFKIGSECFSIVIENKIFANIHGKQLSAYKEKIGTIYKEKGLTFDEELVEYIFLYTEFKEDANDEIEKAKHEGYIPLTYQELYESVLSKMAEYSLDYTFTINILDYIHGLASYIVDGYGTMITTKQDAECLERIFKKNEMKDLIISLRDSSTEAYNFYSDPKNKAFITLCFIKYTSLLNKKVQLDENESEIKKHLNAILNKQRYMLTVENKTENFRSIRKMLLYIIIDYFYKEKNYSVEDIEKRLNSLFPWKLIISTDEEIQKYKYWYEKVMISEKEYYVLTNWAPQDYDDFKDTMNSANLGFKVE